MVEEIKRELQENILPYWIKNIKLDNGLFLGRIDGNEQKHPEAAIGGIMTARILWTYASAYRILGNPEYLDMAKQAKFLIFNYFYDKTYGGTYWSLNPDGTCLDSKKQIYAIAFTIYGLAELYRACGDKEALELAQKLYADIETHSFDIELNGFFEAFQRDWSEIQDMRLSDKDANERKTMNTHLHVLEAYTCLYRVWKNGRLRTSLENLIELFLENIIGQNGHLQLFFSDDWKCPYKIDSYGHDIECSWLLHEAAIVLEDEELLARVEAVVPSIAKAASEGLEMILLDAVPKHYDDTKFYTGMYYEKKDEELDMDKHWWVQAEAVVGFYNLYQLTGDKEALKKAQDIWAFIRDCLVDKENGEWYWSVKADGNTNTEDDKAGFWKCPYHNGRMCMEIIERCEA